MVTAEELTVAITSTGVSETREDLEGMEGAMEETAESASGAAEDLEGFSQRIQGAMSAALAGVAIAVGGLLNQIPVLSEVAASLGAVFSAIGLQIDQLLRDLGAGGLTGAFFEVANVINSLEGTAADLAGVFGIVATAIGGAVTGVVGYAAAAAYAAGEAAVFISTLKGIGAAIAGVVAGISTFTAGLAVAAAAVIALLVAILTNFRGARDKFAAIVLGIRDAVVNGFQALKDGAINVLDGFAGGVGATLMDVAARFTSWAADLAASAREWGRKLIEGFLQGIRSAIGQLREFLGNIRDIGASVGVTVPSLGGVGGGGGGGGGGASSGRPRFGGSGGSGGDTYLDGRSVSEDTGRYRSDPSRRRGI